MKRLTKADCESAAKELAKLAYDKKIEEAEKKQRWFGDKLIASLIPKPLMGCLNEYADLFADKSKRIPIRSEKCNGFQITYCQSNAINPLGDRKVFIIDDGQYREAAKLVNNVNDLCKAKRDYVKSVTEALYSLRTKAKIEEDFPEALPYLSFGEDGAKLPAPKFDYLRSLLK